jgi:hypothetical protein
MSYGLEELSVDVGMSVEELLEKATYGDGAWVFVRNVVILLK